MSLESERQTALPIVGLTVVIAGFGMAKSKVLVGVGVILPYLVVLWLVRTHHLRLTKQGLENYPQICKSLNNKEINNAVPYM